MIDAAEPTIETHEWEIPAYKLDAFKAEIAHANKEMVRFRQWRDNCTNSCAPAAPGK